MLSSVVKGKFGRPWCSLPLQTNRQTKLQNCNALFVRDGGEKTFCKKTLDKNYWSRWHERFGWCQQYPILNLRRISVDWTNFTPERHRMSMIECEERHNVPIGPHFLVLPGGFISFTVPFIFTWKGPWLIPTVYCTVPYCTCDLLLLSADQTLGTLRNR